QVPRAIARQGNNFRRTRPGRIGIREGSQDQPQDRCQPDAADTRGLRNTPSRLNSAAGHRALAQLASRAEQLEARNRKPVQGALLVGIPAWCGEWKGIAESRKTCSTPERGQRSNPLAA